MPKTLTDTQISWALYAIRDVVARRRIQNNPIPSQLLKLHDQLTTTSAGDGCGSGNADTEAKLKNEDLINSDEAATLLGCSPRWVREIHTDLDGRRVAGKWCFPKHHVVEYAQNRDAHRVARTRR